MLAGPDHLYGKLNLGTMSTERLTFGIHNFVPGKRHDMHAHPTWEQFYYVISGQARIEVADEEAIVGPGGTAYLPPTVKHAFEPAGDQSLEIVLAMAVLDQTGPDGQVVPITSLPEQKPASGTGFRYIHAPDHHIPRFEGYSDKTIPDAKTQAGDSLVHAGPDALYADLRLGNFSSIRLTFGVHHYRPGLEHDLHAHPTWEQFYYVISGQARVTVGDEEQVIGAGGSAYLPAGVPHGFKSVGDETLVMALTGCVLD